MRLVPFPVTLKDGKPVLVREVSPEDRHLLEVGYEHLSDRSRHFRFLAARGDLTASELDTFTASNCSDHVAIGAVTIGPSAPEPVGIARYIRLRDRPHAAEMAVTIVDSHQGRGLGGLLIAVLAKFAGHNRISEFYALVDRANTPMLRLLGQLGGTRRSSDKDEIEFRIPIGFDCVQLPPSPFGDRFRKAYELADIAHE